jgi:hypothetical protein
VQDAIPGDPRSSSPTFVEVEAGASASMKIWSEWVGDGIGGVRALPYFASCASSALIFVAISPISVRRLSTARSDGSGRRIEELDDHGIEPCHGK